MTPALPMLLMGQVVALSAPAPPEASGDYAVSRIGLVAMLLMLAAQEAERGPAAVRAENAAIAALLAQAGEVVDDAAADESWSGQEARNAILRRALIGLHEAAETRRDRPLQRRILDLYVQMAHGRRLTLAGAG